MEANLLSPRRIIFFGSMLAAARCRDPASAAYSMASVLMLVLFFRCMSAVARAPAGPRRQWLRAAVVALCFALTGLVQLQFYVPALPLSTALAIWAVSATTLSAFFLVGTARPQVAR
uniref:Uncharacterized protein n=1 Tax=Oryza meridionalis TaxID=40149 RepID=A0A0E0DNT1_9ORYZ